MSNYNTEIIIEVRFINLNKCNLQTPYLDHRIGLRQPFKTFHQLRQVNGILGLYCNSDDRGHGELHHLHVVSFLESSDCSGFNQELINSDKTTDVTSWDILNGLHTASHHQNGPL